MRSASAGQSPGASHELLLQGYGFIDWENQGLRYSLAGDLPVERLREITAAGTVRHGTDKISSNFPGIALNSTINTRKLMYYIK